jgi:hypothetical protein
MENQIFRLNALRADFQRWADSNEPSTWEINLNKIGGNLSAFGKSYDPVILLDCTSGESNWFLCVNTNSVDEKGCYPIEDLSNESIYEIRRIVETWLVRKDIESLNM